MKKILINDTPWQTRIAITQDGRLQHIYFSAHAQEPLERAYFKGKVTKVLPGIQTAFVDIGQARAGFLHISEIDREMALNKFSDAIEDEESPRTKKPRRTKPDIAKILKEGEEILVQVSKEPVYEKGAKLTTCFTLPGRFIVLMPNIPRIGVSKKIADRDERQRLKSLVRENLPQGMGAIIRTTSENRTDREIVADLNFLVKQWQIVEKAFKDAKPEEKIYEDIDVPLQIIRDHLDDSIEEVIVDDRDMQHRVHRFVKDIAPEYADRVKIYAQTDSIFDHYDLEKQIEATLAKKVYLKSGGSLIIESTEAMTVIDVNTGRFIGKTAMEDTILKTNLEAADEIARQLRLRNIGGLIVIDFIDMAVPANRHKLFNHFEKTLREQDKFQSVVLKVSEFGLVQMTRKRSGKTLVQELTATCDCCKGLGFIKSVRTQCYEVLQAIKSELSSQKVGSEISIHLNPALFDYISGTEYKAIFTLEKLASTKITLASDKQLALGTYKIVKQ
jgi:ribonuclease G